MYPCMGGNNMPLLISVFGLSFEGNFKKKILVVTFLFYTNK